MARLALAVVFGLVLAHVRRSGLPSLPPLPVSMTAVTLGAFAVMAAVAVVIVRALVADRRAGWRTGGAR